MINNSSTHQRLYANVFAKQDSLFEKICTSAVKVQECSEDEKKEIFDNNIPDTLYFVIAEWMENKYDCLGFSNTILNKFCFSNKNKEVPAFKNTCDSRLSLYIKGIGI